MKPIKSTDIDALKAETCPECGSDITWEINDEPKDSTDWFYSGECTNQKCLKDFYIEAVAYSMEEA